MLFLLLESPNEASVTSLRESVETLLRQAVRTVLSASQGTCQLEDQEVD